MSTQPADGVQRYDLFTRDGAAGFAFKLTDEGLSLADKSLSVMRDGTWTRVDYADIAAINLQLNKVGPRSGYIGTCTIELGNGERIVVSNVNARGLADGVRDGIYRRFVVDLHKHLADAEETKPIAFTSGFGQGRNTMLFIGVVLGSGLFLVLPLILYATTNAWQMLLLLPFGAALMVPAWRVFSSNQQATYDPSSPPDLLP